MKIYGSELKEKTDFYNFPVKPSNFGIFESTSIESPSKLFLMSDVQKLFVMKNEDVFVFFPLLHTEHL